MPTETTDKIGQRIRNITADLKRYIEKRVELLAITVGEHYSELGAKAIQKGAGVFLLAVAFVLLLVALAEWIGALLESQPLGYVIVSVPLIVIGWLMYQLKPESLNKKLQDELDADVVRLLDRYEKKTDQSLSSIQTDEAVNGTEKNDERK